MGVKARLGLMGRIGAAMMLGIAGAPLMSPLAAVVRYQASPSRRRHARQMQERKLRPLNRSRHWPPAYSYKDARRKSPFPNSPVR